MKKLTNSINYNDCMANIYTILDQKIELTHNKYD